MTSVPAPATGAPVEPAPRVAPSIEPLAAADEPQTRRPGVPKLLIAVRRYSWATLGADVTAGVTVGLVALPLAMAFAIASGLPPEAGIYCAIVTGLIISACGGSMVQIGGPTGAFVVVIAGIVATYGVAGLFMCTMMAGACWSCSGWPAWAAPSASSRARWWWASPTASPSSSRRTQLREFFGLTMTHMPGDFVGRMRGGRPRAADDRRDDAPASACARCWR